MTKLIHHYLELREDDKIIKRIKSSVESMHIDTRILEYHKKENQKTHFIISSKPEKIIK